MKRIAPKNNFRVLIALIAFAALATSGLLISPPMAAQSEENPCEAPVITSDGKFIITLEDGAPTRDGSLVTFTYEICSAGTGRNFPALSHGILGLAQIICLDLADGKTLNDLVVACSLNGEDGACRIGPDPTTGVTGVKIDTTSDQMCNTLSFTLDESALAEGFRIGVGIVQFGTKGGQSIGFADVCGPICVEEDQNDQGCTPGYWKNHPESWEGYATTTKLKDVFTGVIGSLQNKTLLEALSFGGGSTLEGAQKILLRAAVAALLNAAHSGVNYPLSPEDVISQVNTALASGDRVAILELAAILDGYNNAGCPLN